jgi:Peptidase A4 family
MVPVPPPPVTPDVATATADNSLCPLSTGQCLASINWGGYAVCTPQPDCSDLNGVPGAVTNVQGTWTVPSITGSQGFGNFGLPATQCSDSENTWYDNSDWVGIDGLLSQTVEQTGTSSDCYYGQAYYYAWYEFYPANSATITSINVHPGNVMTASVTYSGGLFTTTITDESTHQSYTSPATAVPGAMTDSAEWIAESAYFNGFLALTQTTPVQFSGATATIGGVTHSIGGWGSDVFYLLMVDYNFGINEETGVATPSTQTLAYAKADTSALGRGGGSFSVDWLSSGP